MPEARIGRGDTMARLSRIGRGTDRATLVVCGQLFDAFVSTEWGCDELANLRAAHDRRRTTSPCERISDLIKAVRAEADNTWPKGSLVWNNMVHAETHLAIAHGACDHGWSQPAP